MVLTNCYTNIPVALNSDYKMSVKNNKHGTFPGEHKTPWSHFFSKSIYFSCNPHFDKILVWFKSYKI